MPVIQTDPPDMEFPAPKSWKDFYYELYYYLQCERVVPGAGIVITDADGRGRLITATGSAGAGGGTPRGFKCTATKDGATDAVLVKYGIVNSIIPDGMSPGDVPPYVIDKVGSNGFTCLGVVVGDVGDPDEGVAVSAFIQCFADTMPDDTDTIFYQQIGSYATTDGTLTVETDGDGIGYQRFELCGGLRGNPQWGPA